MEWQRNKTRSRDRAVGHPQLRLTCHGLISRVLSSFFFDFFKICERTVVIANEAVHLGEEQTAVVQRQRMSRRIFRVGRQRTDRYLVIAIVMIEFGIMR